MVPSVVTISRVRKVGAVPRVAVVIGLLLVAVGVIAWLASGGPSASPTALIPAVIGVIVLVAGLLAGRGGEARKHAMHAAAAVALLGALGSIGQLVASPSAGSDNAEVATVAGVLNLLLCTAFVVLAVRSFVAARRAGTGA
jgi:FtsH-binding integral membrane protein